MPHAPLSRLGIHVLNSISNTVQHLFTTNQTLKHVKDLIRNKEIQEAPNRQCSYLKESYICVLLANQT